MHVVEVVLAVKSRGLYYLISFSLAINHDYHKALTELKVRLCLRSFPCFAVRSSSAHEGNIILEIFRCSLTKIIQLNCQLVKLIGKFEICSI